MRAAEALAAAAAADDSGNSDGGEGDIVKPDGEYPPGVRKF